MGKQRGVTFVDLQEEWNCVLITGVFEQALKFMYSMVTSLVESFFHQRTEWKDPLDFSSSFFNSFAHQSSLPTKDAEGSNGLVAMTPYCSKKREKGCYWGLHNVRYIKSFFLSRDRPQLYLIQDIALQNGPERSSKSDHRATEHDLSTAWKN